MKQITEAVIQNLRSRWPTVRVTGFSMGPADTARRYGIPAHELWRVFEALATNRSEEARKIERQGEEMRAMLAAQYDLVLDILSAPHVAATPAARERVH